MARLLRTRLASIEKQLHVAERLARENAHPLRVLSAIQQSRKALIVLKFDLDGNRVPVTTADIERCTDEQRRHGEYLARKAKREDPELSDRPDGHCRKCGKALKIGTREWSEHVCIEQPYAEEGVG